MWKTRNSRGERMPESAIKTSQRHFSTSDVAQSTRLRQRGNIGVGRHRSLALFAIGTRKSTIASVAVPVVQRIEQGFPKGKTEFLPNSASVIRCAQIAFCK